MNKSIKTACESWIKLVVVVVVALAILGQNLFAESAYAEVHESEADHQEENKEDHEEDHGDDHESEGQQEEGRVELSLEQIERAGIGLAEVGHAKIREVLPLYGLVVPNAEGVQSVGARFQGVIRSVSKQIGDLVRQGETLATVESNDSLKSYSVKSSINGVITERNANVGEQTSDKMLFVVADFSSVWVDLSLFPGDVAKVHVGQRARINSNDGATSAEGEVVYVAPFGSSANQTIKARVLLNNPDRLWAPGHFITAEITLSETEVPLSVRNEAVQIVEQDNVVFVKGEEGFEPRPVSLGRTDGEFSEVLAGLHSNETYVTRNSFILKSELGKGEAEHGH